MIAKTLLAFGESVPPAALFPTVLREAEGFALKSPYAFCLAVCLDRGTRAEIIWTIPYDIHARLGHLDPYRIRELSISELSLLFSQLPRRPRYVHDAPATVQELTAMVCDELRGDASRLWAGKSAAYVKRAFMRIHGVGPGIANLAVLLIEKAFGIQFADLDRPKMDIKPDVNTMRVLYRLGASREETPHAATQAARSLNPTFPGGLDAPLWVVGREYCHHTKPTCHQCPLNRACPKVGIDAPDHAQHGAMFAAGARSLATLGPESARGPDVHAPEFPKSLLSPDDLGRMRRALLRAMSQLGGDAAERQPPGAQLRRLTDEGRIPREISAMMRSIIEARNVAEYEGREMSRAQSRALLAAWQAVLEWAQTNGVALEDPL